MVSANLLISQILNGITIGLIYVLAALGLSIILGQIGVVNFAHGSFYAIGAYIAYAVVEQLGLNVFIALPASMIITGILGAIIIFAINKPLRDRHPLEPMVALVGLTFLVREGIRSIWGAAPKSLNYDIFSFTINISTFNFSYSGYLISVMFICILILIGTYYLFNNTDLGIRSLASIQNRDIASALGVSIDKISIIIIAISCGLAGLGGALAGPIFTVEPNMGIELIALFFAIVIAGGLGSIEGTVIAGLLFGLAQSVPSIWFQQIYSEIFVFIVFVFVLMIRPRGIMGLREVIE